MDTMADLDLINRDPNGINAHLQCSFEDVLAEPDGTHSMDCVWKLSYTSFNCWKGCCYKLSTLLCGIWISAYWGCEFASAAFTYIWCYTPKLKLMAWQCGYIQKVWGMYISCCLDPLCTSCGQIFHAFKK